MHLLGGAEDGIGRAHLAAAATADAQLFGHRGDLRSVIGESGQVNGDSQLEPDHDGQRLAARRTAGW